MPYLNSPRVMRAWVCLESEKKRGKCESSWRNFSALSHRKDISEQRDVTQQVGRLEASHREAVCYQGSREPH